MGQIKSIYDAIIKTKVAEDQCTNFLVYLLDKLPKTILLEIIKTADLQIDTVDDIVDINVQYPLEASRPDAVIKFSDGKFLILETKLYPDTFNKIQFINHHQGGKKEFGKDNYWCLFLSGDQQCPADLRKLKARNFGKIGFISWRQLLEILNDKLKLNGFSNSIIINEFLIFAKHYKLGKLTTMNKQELKTFIENYQTVALKQDAAKGFLNKSIDEISQRIIFECDELVKKNEDDLIETLPCIYRAFNIKRWHIKESSAFVFFDILLKKVGIVLCGFQDKTEMKKLQSLWDEKYKKLYRQNPNLTAVTWVEKDEDDFAIGEHGYFKPIEASSGKLFNPFDIPEIRDNSFFYWGLVSPLDIEKIDEKFYNKTASDFKILLSTFLNGK